VATPATGYDFIKWTKNGQQVSTNASYTFNVTESAAYVAHFEQHNYTINLIANPEDGGSITGGGTYHYGETCNATAVANEGFDFVSWAENGNIITTNSSLQFSVTGDRTLVANFVRQTFDVKVNISPDNAGEVTGEGTYSYGDEVTLTVTPFGEYDNVVWMDEDDIIVCEGLTYVFTVTETRILTVVITTEGIGEQNGNFMVYPNPVNDKLTIEAQESIDKLEIYNLMGALVYSQNDCSNKAEIAVSELPTGIYFLRLTMNGGTQVLRFVKE